MKTQKTKEDLKEELIKSINDVKEESENFTFKIAVMCDAIKKYINN
ncbi:MAG: hypothetical protein ACFFHD_05605 [Promethearchaeota archaeon]